MKWRAIPQIPKWALLGFLEDNGFTLAGALAFYALLSVAPLLVLLVTVFGYLGPETEQRLVAETERLIGPQASEGIELIVRNARMQRFAASVSAGVSLAILVFSATTVFAQLQFSLNSIFNVRPKRGILAGWLYKRFLSLLMVIAIGIILVLTVVVTSFTTMIFRHGGPAPQIIDLIISFGVFTSVFVIMFRVLPDVVISWKDTWVGGMISGLLVVAGEYVIGEYLQSGIGVSIYGAAASLVVLLLWIYYSAIIFFFGAELTQAYARCCGHEIIPNKFAEWDFAMAQRLQQQKLQRQKEQEQVQATPTEAKPSPTDAKPK